MVSTIARGLVNVAKKQTVEGLPLLAAEAFVLPEITACLGEPTEGW